MVYWLPVTNRFHQSLTLSYRMLLLAIVVNKSDSSYLVNFIATNIPIPQEFRPCLFLVSFILGGKHLPFYSDSKTISCRIPHNIYMYYHSSSYRNCHTDVENSLPLSSVSSLLMDSQFSLSSSTVHSLRHLLFLFVWVLF